MKVLIIGSGGREHALAWKLKQSPQIERLFVAPGNAGTASIATNLPIQPQDFPPLAQSVKEHKIGLTLVGPETPLAAGVVDYFQSQGLAIFGPSKAASLLEASKAFAKEFMVRRRIPCARGAAFTSFKEARDYVTRQPLPIVVKADGLVGGKGSIVARTLAEAEEALRAALVEKAFGEAGEKVVVEEFLEGREVSLLAFTDGHTVIPMLPVCDYKRAYDGDQGPNTGGMGSYGPPSFFGPKEVELAVKTILTPAVEGMAREGRPFHGILYAGLMVTRQGPKVLEFNCRFGDPETQVILPLLKTDLVEVLLAVVEGRLDKARVEWQSGGCVGVVLASSGYPGKYQTGFPITGWDKLDRGVEVFHAGTKKTPSGEIVTDGGRVLTVTATGGNVAQARAKAYLNVPCLQFQGCFYRKDIAAAEVS